MATPVVFNGVNYSVPAFGDVGYAQGPGNLSAYLIAIASGTFQITGGLFSLTAQADFGPNFGLTAVNFTSRTANPAVAGAIRLANIDTINWRNFANTLDLPLGVNASDQLTFNGVVISTAAAGGTVNPGVAGRVTVYPAAGNTVDDVYVQNAQNIDILIAAQATRSVALEYTIPNPGDAVTAATFALLQLAQTFTALQTFAADISLPTGHSVIFNGSVSGAVTMHAPATVTTPYTFTLPPNPGTSQFFLQTDGAGTTVWAQASQTTAFREDYIVGTASGTYTGSLTVFNLANPYAVGAHSLLVTLDGDVQTIGATIDYVETNSTTVTFNNALVVGQKVSFIFQTAVTSGGGTVNSGTAPRLAYYASSGTTISEIAASASANSQKITNLAAGTVSGDALSWGQAFTSGAHTFSPTTTGIVGTTTNDSATTGIVGEYVPVGAGTQATGATGVFTDVMTFALTAGDWDVYALIIFDKSTATWTRVEQGFSLVAGNTAVQTGPWIMQWASSATTPLFVTGTSFARWSLSSAQNVYVKMAATFSAGQARIDGAAGFARRVR